MNKTGEIKESMAAVAAGQEPDPHDALRSPLFIREIEVVCSYRRIRGIKKMRSGIKLHGAAGNGRAVNLERTSLQVDGVRARRIQVRVNAADA